MHVLYLHKKWWPFYQKGNFPSFSLPSPTNHVDCLGSKKSHQQQTDSGRVGILKTNGF